MVLATGGSAGAVGVPIARSAAAVPCPLPDPPPARPARPSTPPLSATDRAVGGAGLVTAGLAAPAGAPAPPGVSAASWVVADLDSGAVLGACGPHEYGIPASVQKLLLVETFLPKLDPHRVVEVTDEDMNFEPGSSAMGLVKGGRYPIETLWLGLLLNSGNDAANVLARLGGGAGGLSAGVAAMNAEARRLGANQTHAATPSGLDGPGQFTSAYDLALIARADFDRDDFRRYAATRQAQVPGQPTQLPGQSSPNPDGFRIVNDNQLLYQYPGALGGKTGYTDLARHSFVGAADRGGRRLLVTLLGAELPARGWQQGAALLNWGYGLPRDAAVGQLVAPAGASPTVTAAPVGGGQRVAGARSGGALSGPLGVGLLALLLGTLVAVVGLSRMAGRRSVR
ncbi:D-alanyl-D-alanine carboxypeptidase family protein [Micromonospora zhanjiangensis]|uniref:D-alanyl-D-alanine carboxypeptidase family protein n=1 Tax=Micromonospora zhanjiangensis TaxID=1522057 RepID=A0ABV8KWV2_9ACTN